MLHCVRLRRAVVGRVVRDVAAQVGGGGDTKASTEAVSEQVLRKEAERKLEGMREAPAASIASALASYSDAVTEPRKVHTVTTSMRMLPQSKGSLKAAGLAGEEARRATARRCLQQRARGPQCACEECDHRQHSDLFAAVAYCGVSVSSGARAATACSCDYQVAWVQ